MTRWAETAFLALGSNLAGPRAGDPRGNVESAIEELRGWVSAGESVCSSLWRSEPMECDEGTPDFVNGVIGLPLGPLGTPVELLMRLQEMELRFGRERERSRNSPRSLDLDIVTYGELQIAAPDLTIPHPGAARRRFVLQPLAEIDPGLRLPGQEHTVAELLLEAPALVMVKLGAPRAAGAVD